MPWYPLVAYIASLNAVRGIVRIRRCSSTAEAVIAVGQDVHGVERVRVEYAEVGLLPDQRLVRRQELVLVEVASAEGRQVRAGHVDAVHGGAALVDERRRQATVRIR